MRSMKSLGVASALIAGGILATGAAAAANLCEIIKSTCDTGCYTFYSRMTDVPANELDQAESVDCAPDPNSVGYVAFKTALNSAPSKPVLECEEGTGYFTCEVWPQGESLTYSWSLPATVQIDSGAAATSVRGFACASGTTSTIAVSAIGPQGAASTTTATVVCH